ncbi:hypothetical protein LCGC14_1905340 [marine sediment metagenome]|uniref:Uncharacterized protein n=1 Tax=marine sediment metagenome TaxID=412755 RepID=A0A0F9I995_9ZZZZ
MGDNGDFKLTKTQMIALATCQRELAAAREQLKIVQEEIGLDLNKNYAINPDGFVHMIKAKPKVETAKKRG